MIDFSKTNTEKIFNTGTIQI